MQFSWTFAMPLLVVMLREASPPWAHTVINSDSEANKNWEFVLAAMVTSLITVDL